jgi:hypothetical protein
MKRPFFLFFLLFNILFVNAQHLVVAQNLLTNIVYLGISNPIAIYVANIPSNQIELKVNQGKITKIGESQYDYQADSIGTAIITIYRTIRHNRIKIREHRFRIIKIPKPIALVGRLRNEDTVLKKEFISQQGVRADLGIILGYACLEGVCFNVISFTTIILRNDSVIYTENTKGAPFTETTKAAFVNLRANDKVIFSSIREIGPSGKIELLDPLEYTIKE